MYRYFCLAFVIACTFLTACTEDKESPRGFSLPEGSAELGKATFVKLQCNACHSTKDVAQLLGDNVDDISVVLGGEVGQVKTYADLVTSIINPSHRLARAYPKEEVALNGVSRMRNYNEVMTVEQLVDLVSYLQPQYLLKLESPRIH